MKLLQRFHRAIFAAGHVTFCHGCSQVCDRACQATASRPRTLARVTSSLPIRR